MSAFLLENLEMGFLQGPDLSLTHFLSFILLIFLILNDIFFPMMMNTLL